MSNGSSTVPRAHALQDVMWSALDEEQLIGRLHRAGQEKTVHVYKLLLSETPDTTLSSISFMKRRLQEIFVGSPESSPMRKSRSVEQLLRR